VPAASPLHYFLKVNGATGDATLKGFAGWFSVDGFDWGVQHTTTIGSATGGAGAGKTSFSPLTVDIHSLAGLATLFGDVAKGGNLGTVELAAVDTVKGQSLEVYDVKLSEVFLTGLENDPGPNGVETALGFEFGKINVTVQPPTTKGSLGPPQTAGFDVITAETTDAVAGALAASAVTTTEVPLESAATPVPADSPLHYFLKVNGATGDATLKGFAGWFSVDGFDWGVQHTTTIGSATGGAGAGKTSFSPLTVDIHSLAGLATLFGDVAKGGNLGTVELAAVDTVKGQSLEVYDVKLSEVFLTGLENDPGPNGVETALGFEFGKVAMTVQPPTTKGSLGPPQTAGFDATTLDANASLLFNPQTIQGLLAPASVGALTDQDPTLQPTLAAARG
jgi:type VI protein secretion system component Hcp